MKKYFFGVVAIIMVITASAFVSMPEKKENRLKQTQTPKYWRLNTGASRIVPSNYVEITQGEYAGNCPGTGDVCKMQAVEDGVNPGRPAFTVSGGWPVNDGILVFQIKQRS